MHVPARGLIRGNGNTEMVTKGAKLGLCGLFVKTALTIVNTMFEIDWVIIISHNVTFSDIDQKPSFSVILWPLESQNCVAYREHVGEINSVMTGLQCTNIYLVILIHLCTIHPHLALPAPLFELSYISSVTDLGPIKHVLVSHPLLPLTYLCMY